MEVTKGFEYQVARETVICGPHARLVIHLKPLRDSPGRAFAVGQC